MFGSLVVWGQSVLGFYVLVTREYGSIDWFFKYMETEVWVGIIFEIAKLEFQWSWRVLCASLYKFFKAIAPIYVYKIDELFLCSFIIDLVLALCVHFKTLYGYESMWHSNISFIIFKWCKFFFSLVSYTCT